jgi:5-methylcytosine-specific restriction endonuclease McrA
MICKKCGIDKPLTIEFYYKNNAVKSGYFGSCKECIKNYANNRKNEYRKTIEEKIKKQNIKLGVQAGEQTKFPPMIDGKRWCDVIKERDKGTCVICNDKSPIMVAHHLNSLDWDRENKFNLNNGITLCVPCHFKFHKKYGFGRNNIQQFDEFKLNNIKDDLKSELSMG